MEFTSDVISRLIYSTKPVLLLFADRENQLDGAEAAAERAGCRIAGRALMADAPARFDAQIGADAMLVVADEPSAGLSELLERLDSAAREGRMTGLVASPVRMIDPISATSLPLSVEVLVDADEAALEGALLQIMQPASARFHDVNSNSGVATLQQLSVEAARIAQVLASLSGSEAPLRGVKPDDRAVEASFVRSIIRARRLREQYFHGELFADPAFDMLLDLYASRLEGTRVAVSSLCIAAAVPPTTALRWIRALTEQGLFVRTADPQDGRRVYIGLSDETARAMGRYLASVRRSGLPAV